MSFVQFENLVPLQVMCYDTYVLMTTELENSYLGLDLIQKLSKVYFGLMHQFCLFLFFQVLVWSKEGIL